MRKFLTALFLVIGVALIAAIVIPNFLKFQGKTRGPRSYRPMTSHETGRYFPPAHGGTTTPNAAAYDAMFFETHGVNPFIDTEDDHLSTFAIDVDTASYTIVRRYLFDGFLPPKEAVRVEEFVNYFKYDYPKPASETFAINLEGAPSKFGGPNYKMLRVGIRGKNIEQQDRKDAVLTFVIDVSGSMAREDRLGLVKRSLRLLIDQLSAGDQVGIVVYGTRGRVIMEDRGLEDRHEILEAIGKLRPEGSTNAEEGLRLGYKLASDAFVPGAINRVILCSDGVANVGITGAEEILAAIKQYADKGITLSTIGFGMGNYNDVLMEKLADKGDGNYAYVDTFDEAQRVFRENLTSVLQVIARDMKVQVDFNPQVVSRYRLLGYENRRVADNDFRDNAVDGGEVGAGHQVTALYEIKLQKNISSEKVATVTLRYKYPDAEEKVIEVSRSVRANEFHDDFNYASPDFKLATAVAEFSEILRKSYWAQDGNIAAVLQTLQQLPLDYRNNPEIIELMNLVSKAGKIKNISTGHSSNENW